MPCSATSVTAATPARTQRGWRAISLAMRFTAASVEPGRQWPWASSVWLKKRSGISTSHSAFWITIRDSLSASVAEGHLLRHPARPALLDVGEGDDRLFGEASGLP